MEVNRILIIEPVGGHGGMDYYDYGLAYGLASNNIKVDYHTCSETNVRQFENVTTFHTFGNIWAMPKWKRLFFFLKYYYSAINSAKINNCQLVHLHFFSFNLPNLLALYMIKLKKLKNVVTVHDVKSFHGKSNSCVTSWVEQKSYELINGVIVHNQSSYKDIQSKGFKLPPIKIIPHGNYSPFVNQLPLPDNNQAINLLFFGQIKEVKGLDILLKAFAIVVKKNKKFKLTIAGRPWKTEIGKYEKLIKELGIKNYVETHFRYIPDKEVEQFYAQSHIVVLPYRRIYQSGVLLLTMSYGRTAITSDLPAFSEIIEPEKNGFLFKSESVDDLASTILSISPEQIERATLADRQTIEGKYNWVNIGKQTKEFYENL